MRVLVSEEDIRVVLGVPKPVHTSIGTIPVRTMTAMETVYWADEISTLINLIRKEARKLNSIDPDYVGAIGVVCKKHPLSVIGLLSGTTGKKPEELGSILIEEYLDLLDAFFERHEAAIERFFGLRERFNRLMTKGDRLSPKSSTPSSPVDGVSMTPDNAHSSSSKSSDESAQHEVSETNSTS